MDMKSVVVLEVKKGDNLFQFLMPIGAPFGECYDAAFQALGKVTEMMKEAAEKAKPADSADEKPAESN